MRKDLYLDLKDKENTHWWHISKKNLTKYLVEKYAKKSPLILDIGCGSGMIMETLSDVGDVSGIDFEKKSILMCKRKGLKRVKVASAEKLPKYIKPFDCVLMLDVLEHVNDVKSLNEVKKVLSKNGVLIITVPAYQWLWSKWDEILYHKKRYSKKGLGAVLAGAGYSISKISYFYSFLVLPVFVIRKIKDRFFRSNKYESDFKISIPLLDNIFSAFTKLELQHIKSHSIPFGLSLFVVAKKLK